MFAAKRELEAARTEFLGHRAATAAMTHSLRSIVTAGLVPRLEAGDYAEVWERLASHRSVVARETLVKATVTATGALQLQVQTMGIETTQPRKDWRFPFRYAPRREDSQGLEDVSLRVIGGPFRCEASTTPRHEPERALWSLGLDFSPAWAPGDRLDIEARAVKRRCFRLHGEDGEEWRDGRWSHAPAIATRKLTLELRFPDWYAPKWDLEPAWAKGECDEVALSPESAAQSVATTTGLNHASVVVVRPLPGVPIGLRWTPPEKLP